MGSLDTVPLWDPSSAAAPNDCLYYFAYGSNLWLDQMEHRCPGSTLIGKGFLVSYRWVISDRGYANVLPSAPPASQTSPSLPEDNDRVTYGLVFTLTKEDMDKLDVYEGTNFKPPSYLKQTLPIRMLDDGRILNSLVYVDPVINEGDSHTEYVGRINKGLRDAELPEAWVAGVIRRWIPEGQGLEPAEHPTPESFFKR